jgi:hypothetical protein
MFGSEKGQQLHSKLSSSTSASAKTGTFEVGHVNDSAKKKKDDDGRLSKAEIKRIEEAINNATSMEEISRLERLLKSGRLPDALPASSTAAAEPSKSADTPSKAAGKRKAKK